MAWLQLLPLTSRRSLCKCVLNPLNISSLSRIEVFGLSFQEFPGPAETAPPKKTLDSINKSYLDVAEWYSAKVMVRIHKSSFLLYCIKKDYKSAKKSQRSVIDNLKLYLNTDDFQLLKEVVRYRDLLARLNDFEEIGKVDKEFDLYPFIR